MERKVDFDGLGIFEIDGHIYKESNEPIEVDDLFAYTDEGDPRDYYGTCGGFSADRTKVVRICWCGMCSPEENFIPIERCKKLILQNPNLN